MPRKSRPERDRLIYELREKNGTSFRIIAKIFGINVKTAFQAYWKIAKKYGKKPPKSAVGLSTTNYCNSRWFIYN
jgi:transposase